MYHHVGLLFIKDELMDFRIFLGICIGICICRYLLCYLFKGHLG